MKYNALQLLHIYLLLLMLSLVSPAISLAQETQTEGATKDVPAGYLTNSQPQNLFNWFSTLLPAEKITFSSLKARVWNNFYNDSSRSKKTFFDMNHSTLSYAKMPGLLQIAAGYTSCLLTFYQDKTDRLRSNMQELLTSAGLDALLSHRLIITTEFGRNQNLSSFSKLSQSFEFSKDVILKPDVLTIFTKQNREIFSEDDSRSPVLAPYKYQNIHDTLISISLPISATDNLIITPIISYAFSMSNSERHDFKDRGFIRPIDKEGAIVYCGIHLSYTF